MTESLENQYLGNYKNLQTVLKLASGAFFSFHVFSVRNRSDMFQLQPFTDWHRHQIMQVLSAELDSLHLKVEIILDPLW